MDDKSSWLQQSSLLPPDFLRDSHMVSLVLELGSEFRRAKQATILDGVE
jgi:hypothetical protein